MRIPFYYLSEQLRDSNLFRIISAPGSGISLGRPRFLLEGQTPDPGKLYITTPDIAQSLPLPVPSSSAILSAFSPEQLMNQVQEIYDVCEQWDEALSGTAAIGDMRELLDEIEAAIGNPVFLRKANFAIVSCSGEIFSNPKLSVLRGSHLPYEYVNALKRDPLFEERETATEPFFFSISGMKQPALAINLFPEEQAGYRLTVLPIQRALTDSDRFLLQLAAGYVVQVLKSTVVGSRFADPTGRKERLVQLFHTGIENENADLTVLEQGFSSLGWLTTHQYCCLSIRIGTLDHLKQTVELLCNQLESFLPTSCMFPHLGSIAVIINLTQAKDEIRAILDRCIYFFRDNDLRTGVSNTFTGFQNLYYYYKQACIALDHASRPQAFLWTQHFSDVVLYYILEQSNREMPLQLICSQQILQIRAYDNEHQTDFYETLEAYIQNKFNAVQTAKALQIHRSTFLYRMERLQTLFGLDLNHRDSLLYVLLSMRMLELSKTMILRE